MEANVRRYFPDVDAYSVDYQIVEGSPRQEMARWAHIKNVDLVIMGRKALRHGKGIVPQQLARKLDCSILFVPQKVRYELKEILIANDFSNYAHAAIAQASRLQKVDPQIRLYSAHVFNLPQGYYRTGKSEEEFIKIVRTHTQKRYEQFMAEWEEAPNMEALYCYDQDNRSAARVLNDTAKEKGADLIVIGSRGHTSTSAFLLGSVSEKLVRINEDCPVLLIKHAHQLNLLEVVDAL